MPATELVLPSLDSSGIPGRLFARRASTVMLVAIVVVVIFAGTASRFILVRDSVTADGVLEPIDVTAIRAEAEGRVSQVLVHTGDAVTAGAVLITMTSDHLLERMHEVEARLEQRRLERIRLSEMAALDELRILEQRGRADLGIVRARASLRDRMASYELSVRAQQIDSLIQNYRAGEHVAMDLAVSDVWAAQSELRQALIEEQRLQLKPLDMAVIDAEIRQLSIVRSDILRQLNRLIVTSHGAGTVLTANVNRLVGTYVRQGDDLMEIGDASGWRAEVYVREMDIHKIAVGDTAAIEVPAIGTLNRDLLRATVERIAPTSASPAGAGAVEGYYRTTLVVDETQLAPAGAEHFRRGYSARAYIMTNRGTVYSAAVERFRKRVGR